ncbi:hypothetical protein HYPSUDRAFT_84412 [Hypholoma sublateritium FD-334 SS-4]|uniref:Uncharacterized protein n=1 Tax=Hypholoma sublateritium (strain FD-334 SS-4) TaxID=945553 RepID=A0A0D2LFX0_HYPSF|nr:hypothetical protein HYPSUDRAFT_84412 [Hypholoma sublateritium FD-334 SS-4]
MFDLQSLTPHVNYFVVMPSFLFITMLLLVSVVFSPLNFALVIDVCLSVANKRTYYVYAQ